MYVLDTNTLIYFFKGMGQVSKHLLATPPNQIGIPAIVLFELETGIAKSNSPEKRRQQLNAMLQQANLLKFGFDEARMAAQIRVELEQQGTPISTYDLLIAATAISCNGTLVTHNTSEFSRVKMLSLTDWFE
jgi:tRNA(fMet)-specific endonuclease VapC